MTTLVGVFPTADHGVEFHRPPWGWQPLWAFCEERHNNLCDAVLYPYDADSSGLDADSSIALGHRLIEDIESGAADDYVNARRTIVSASPDMPCDVCGGTGVRTDDVGHDLGMIDFDLSPDHADRLGRSQGWCNSCRGEGRLFAWEKLHDLKIRDIAEFALFLLDCGGFNIK